MINYLYGVLTDNKVSPETKGYRFTDASRQNAIQKRYLAQIMPKDEESLASAADVLIRLMRSSPYWVDFIAEKDPVNTYDVDVEVSSLNPEFKTKLFNWVDKLAISSSKYPVTSREDKIQKLINALYTIATAEG